MSINLIEVLKNSFTEKSYQDVSQHVGINHVAVKNGINNIIPVVLATILGNNTANNVSQPEWWNALKDDYPYSEDEFVDTNHIQSSSFRIKGREIISDMFHSNHDKLVSSVSTIAGIQKEKAVALIEVSVPLIVTCLNNWMRKKEWKFKDLIEDLNETKPSIVGALPAGISPASFGVNNTPKSNVSETIEPDIPAYSVVKREKKTNGLMWFIGVVVLAIALWYIMGSKSCNRNVDQDVLVPGKSDTISINQHIEEVMDGTYYAYEVKHDLTIRY